MPADRLATASISACACSIVTPGLQPPDRENRVVQPVLAPRIDVERHPDVAIRQQRQRRRRDAHDGAVDAVQRQAAADERRIGAEAPPPEPLADHRDLRRCRAIPRRRRSSRRAPVECRAARNRLGLIVPPVNCSGSPPAGEIEAGVAERAPTARTTSACSLHDQVVRDRGGEGRQLQRVVPLRDQIRRSGCGYGSAAASPR